MIPDVLKEYLVFPLLVFAVGLVTLIMEAWLQLTVVALITAIIWFISRAARRNACNK